MSNDPFRFNHRNSWLACFAIFVLCNGLFTAHGATTTVTFDSGSETVFYVNGVTPLSGGTSTDGNGTVLQLGYFSGASVSNNFSGTWTPLTGNLGANSAFSTTSIGDLNGSGAGDGTYANSIVFTTGGGSVDGVFPSATTIPLAIRFYDATTVGGASNYNTVSNDAWLWQTPAESPNDPTIFLSLDDSGLEWESIAVFSQAGSTAFTTSIATAIPEPSMSLLSLLGTAAVFLRRRRR